MRKTLIFLILLVSLFESVRAQKGDKSISAGPLISFPLEKHTIPGYKTGVGIEVTGQYYLASKSSLLGQIGLTSFGTRQVLNSYEKNLKLMSLKGGYRYDIGSSGFFINGLVGTDIDTEDGFTSAAFTLGAGKRFPVKDVYFIDAGIDYIGGDTEKRVNIKVAFSILQRPKKG
ncbi:MAG: hypothetical protein JWP81_508 [Ferruginibacter sp.]|nr:hypothetical protein [Ferruginibacter sp.]